LRISSSHRRHVEASISGEEKEEEEEEVEEEGQADYKPFRFDDSL